MARGQIVTKLHKLGEMADPLGTPASMFKDSMYFFKTAAHYVVSDSISELMTRSDAQKSIQAVHEAGIRALPYESMLVEFEHMKDFREFVLLTQIEDSIFAEYAFLMTNSADSKFDRRVTTEYGISKGELFGVVLPEKLNIEIYDEGYLIRTHSPNDIDEGMRTALVAAATFAMNVAFLCLNMQGVEKEVIDCAPLNKQRLKRNKPPIPRHTSLYIARVWRRDGTSFAYSADGSKRSVRVHMRAAHTRNQAVGKGRTERKLVLIPACLVNYHPGDAIPEMPKRIVRA